MGAILSAAMLGHQPDPVAHYSGLAREAVLSQENSRLKQALREACAEIEQLAGYAFRHQSMSQVDFEIAWSTESSSDAAHYAKWCELKTVAGLPITDLPLTDLDPPQSWDDV